MSTTTSVNSFLLNLGKAAASSTGAILAGFDHDLALIVGALVGALSSSHGRWFCSWIIFRATGNSREEAKILARLKAFPPETWPAVDQALSKPALPAVPPPHVAPDRDPPPDDGEDPPRLRLVPPPS